MFKKYFLIVLFTFAIPFGHAQDNRWELVETASNNGTNITLYIDKLTIQRVGNEVTYWDKRNYDKEDKFGNRSGKANKVINCKTREVRLKFFAGYSEVDNKGELRFSSNASGDNAMNTPILPDSVDESFYYRVCGKK